MLEARETPGLPLVVLRPGANLHNSHTFRGFETWEAFERSGIEPLGFLLEDEGVGAEEWLYAIRSSAWWARAAMVAGADNSPLGVALSDGVATLSEAVAMGTRILRAQHLLTIQPQMLDLGERVLYFLTLRDGAVLRPVLDWRARQLYRFPLVEALGGDEARVATVLTDLKRRRLLEGATPIDRVRHCRRCDAAHPHFYDVCPHCRSIQIERGAGLHCFTCGHVAPQEAFEQGGALQCPQCKARLRHIGVDYDRPLTQYTCRDCQHLFIETGVAVRCLDCGQQSTPEELDLRIVAPLRLTMSGRRQLMNLQALTDGDLREDQGEVSMRALGRLLDWVRAVGIAGGQSGFCVVRIGLEAALGEPADVNGTVALEVARRVREVLTPDMVSALDRSANTWVLVRREQLEALTQRVRSVPLEREGAPLSLNVRWSELSAASEPWGLAQEFADAQDVVFA